MERRLSCPRVGHNRLRRDCVGPGKRIETGNCRGDATVAGHGCAGGIADGRRPRRTANALAGIRARAIESNARGHELSGDGYCEHSVALDHSALDISAVLHPGVWAAADYSRGLVAMAAAGDRAGCGLSSADPGNASHLAGHGDSSALSVPGRDDLSRTPGARATEPRAPHGVLSLDLAWRRAGRRFQRADRAQSVSYR